jgi:endonuclease/exonuclease/phosphatase (EEP) superfamily protein YafD
MIKHLSDFGNELMPIEVHYATLDLGENDILVEKFTLNENNTTFDDVIEWIDWTLEKSNNQSKKVFLVSFEESGIDHVFVSEFNESITEFVGVMGEQYPNRIHIQEYPSYESAYQVALMMKEISPLCYDKTK